MFSSFVRIGKQKLLGYFITSYVTELRAALRYFNLKIFHHHSNNRNLYQSLCCFAAQVTFYPLLCQILYKTEDTCTFLTA